MTCKVPIVKMIRLSFQNGFTKKIWAYQEKGL